MKFDESVDETTIIQFDTKGNKVLKYEDPKSREDILAACYWTKLKNRIFGTEKSVLQGNSRHVQL